MLRKDAALELFVTFYAMLIGALLFYVGSVAAVWSTWGTTVASLAVAASGVGVLLVAAL